MRRFTSSTIHSVLVVLTLGYSPNPTFEIYQLQYSAITFISIRNPAVLGTLAFLSVLTTTSKRAKNIVVTSRTPPTSTQPPKDSQESGSSS